MVKKENIISYSGSLKNDGKEQPSAENSKDFLNRKQNSLKQEAKIAVHENITKLYITSHKHSGKRLVEYAIMSHKCYLRSLNKVSDWEWIASVEYEDYNDLLKLLKLNNIREIPISIKRIFKSMPLKGKFRAEPSRSFLLRTAMGISGLIKKKVDIRIENNRADDWQKELINIWQGELEKPNFFKKSGITPVIDISPKGEITFVIVKGKDYVITYFKELIDQYT